MFFLVWAVDYWWRNTGRILRTAQCIALRDFVGGGARLKVSALAHIKGGAAKGFQFGVFGLGQFAFMGDAD